MIFALCGIPILVVFKFLSRAWNLLLGMLKGHLIISIVFADVPILLCLTLLKDEGGTSSNFFCSFVLDEFVYIHSTFIFQLIIPTEVH